jgi:hypothetical protein
MAWNTNLGNWLASSPRERELSTTREAWNEAERHWRSSPLGKETIPERALAFLRMFLSRFDEWPADTLIDAFSAVAGVLFDYEDTGPFEPNWTAISADATIAVRFREMLARRRRYAADYLHINEIVTTQIAAAFTEVMRVLPPACFEQGQTDGSSLEVPLIELVDDPASLIERIILTAYTDETMGLDLFHDLRLTYATNILVASGLPPDANMETNQARLKMPTMLTGKAPGELVDLYFRATPFADLLERPVPLHIPEEVRFEHGHILGGTGHGKTQLLQKMIHADLVAAQQDGRSVVVIDSQGDLIGKLVRLALFDPDTPHSLSARLVLIDPADVEFPAALNLFDAHLDRLAEYRPVDRERVLNGVVELYETMFGDMLGAELTQKQGVVFRYLARLMVTIPGATIHTLMQLMEDGRPFKPQMQQLEGSARYFFETEFFHPSFAATKKQILRRLWGVLSTPAFERMFAQPTNKLDLYEATRAGKIILISTAKDLLKRDGSALLGRFFINMLAQAALERSVIAQYERTPTFVYVDEAQEYFDEGVETILQQARKYRIGMVLAHQSVDQASPALRSALFSNTSFKAAGGVSARDARALAGELHTTPEYIDGMRRRRDRTEFAAWIKHWTPSAIRLSVPLGHLERQPTLTEEAYDALLERNRARYAGNLEDVQRGFRPRSETPMPEPEVDPPLAPTERDPEAATERQEPVATPWQPAPPRERPAPRTELGKGGAKHRYLQSLVKELAEQQGFKATIEAPVPGGQVDVLLEQGGLVVAVEVSVTTPVEWERENLRKCLAGSAGRVALVLAKSQTTAKRYREAVVEGLSAEDRDRLSVLYAEDLPDFIASLAPAPEPEERIVKGYRVKVSQTALSPEEANARRDTLARLVAQSMKRPEH